MWRIFKLGWTAIVLNFFFFFPLCKFPVVRDTEFCVAVSAVPNALFPLFYTIRNGAVKQTLLGGIGHSFHSPENATVPHPYPYTSSRNAMDVTSLGQDLRRIITSSAGVEEMIKRRTFRGKDTTLRQLRMIETSAKQCAPIVQQYTTQLLASVDHIMLSLKLTLEIAHSSSSLYNKIMKKFWTFMLVTPDVSDHTGRHVGLFTSQTVDKESQLHQSVLYSLKTYEILHHKLGSIGEDLHRYIRMLDNDLAVLLRLLDEAIESTKGREEPERRLFFSLINLQSTGEQASATREKSLSSTLKIAKTMVQELRGQAFEMEVRLNALQSIAEDLHTRSADSLFDDGPFPQECTINILIHGCQALRGELVKL